MNYFGSVLPCQSSVLKEPKLVEFISINRVNERSQLQLSGIGSFEVQTPAVIEIKIPARCNVRESLSTVEYVVRICR